MVTYAAYRFVSPSLRASRRPTERRDTSAMSSKEDLESEVQRLLAMNTKTVDSKTESVKSPVKKENKKKGKSGAGDEKTQECGSHAIGEELSEVNAVGGGPRAEF